MPIKVVVEFQAKPGARAELTSLLADTGVYTPVMELVAAPFRATRIAQLS
jgi:hypothetical protein